MYSRACSGRAVELCALLLLTRHAGHENGISAVCRWKFNIRNRRRIPDARSVDGIVADRLVRGGGLPFDDVYSERLENGFEARHTAVRRHRRDLGLPDGLYRRQ